MASQGPGRRIVLAAALALPGMARAGTAWRPDRPVRMILPSGAGSGADVVASALAARLAEQLGQAVVVDNQPQGVGIAGDRRRTPSSPAAGAGTDRGDQRGRCELRVLETMTDAR
ncbi:MAG: hypothetical protein K2X49_18645 [Acetobacteraceae bacterium]|nr:hypothetical protein [Acetobacteraceae bacterium]